MGIRDMRSAASVSVRRAAMHELGRGRTGSSSVLSGTSPPLPPKDAKSGEELDGPGGAAADGM